MDSLSAVAAKFFWRPLFFLAPVTLLAGLTMAGQTASSALKAAPAAKPAVAATEKPVAKPSARAAASSACTVKATGYKGWKAEELANKWVKLEIVPDLGGRLMQVNFDGHDMLYNNPKVTAKPTTPGARVGNPGGDKIWPLPEGSQDEQHWSGAGGHLDGGAYTLKILSSTGGKCAVRLTGPYNAEIGQRYIRDISIGSDTPIISFHIVMENMTGYPQTWSEQTVTEYAVSDPVGSENFDKKWYGVVEVNPNSAYPMDAERHADDCEKPTGPPPPLSEYPKGYHLRSGPDVNDAYEVKDGTLRVHWNDIMQEVWVDTPSGWLATVNGDNGYTMVERHKIDPNHEYPSKASIIFYSSGEPCPRRGRPPGSREGPFVEAEVNSPMVTLDPGETYAMDTTWYPTRMTDDFKKPTWSGVIGQPLAATRTSDGLLLSGEFGVFYPGTLVAHLYPRTQEDNTMKVVDVTPTEMVHLQTTIQAPPNTSRVSIHLVDDKGVDRGPLGEVRVNPPPAGDGGRRQ
jgi:hypothetical protein